MRWLYQKYLNFKLWWLNKQLTKLQGDRRRLKIKEIRQTESILEKRYGQVPIEQVIKNAFRTGGRNQVIARAELRRRKQATA